MTAPKTSAPQPTPALPDSLLTVREVAELPKISTSSVYRLVDRREIPFHRLPRGLRFDAADLKAYLDRCRVESA